MNNHTWTVRCPGLSDSERRCQGWVVDLYLTHPGAPYAGLCRACSELTYLSECSPRPVAHLRADLRLGDYRSTFDALKDPQTYPQARAAMEHEGLVNDEQRLFTLPDGGKRRREYLKGAT